MLLMIHSAMSAFHWTLIFGAKGECQNRHSHTVHRHPTTERIQINNPTKWEKEVQEKKNAVNCVDIRK